jgi:hypothetical protein
MIIKSLTALARAAITPPAVAVAAGPQGPVPFALPVVDWVQGLVCVATYPATAVRFGGNVYACTVSHTAGAVFDPDNFTLVAEKGEPGADSPLLTVNSIEPDGAGNIQLTPADVGAEDVTEKGQPNGYAELDATGKVPVQQMPEAVIGAVKYQSGWNANANTPTIPAAAVGNKGHYYVVTTAGATNIDGITDWKIGDWIISNGSAWEKVDSTDQVTSVAGRQGAVTLAVADVTGAEATANKGANNGYAGLDSSGIVPAAQSRVQSVAGRTGAVTLTASDIGGGTFTGDYAFQGGYVTVYTRSPGDNSLHAASTAYVDAATGASIVAQCYLNNSAGTLTLQRKNGKYITCGTTNMIIPEAGLAVSASGVVANTLYFIYAYDLLGVLTVEYSTTGWLVAAASGLPVQNGNTGKTLVGLAYATATNTWSSVESETISHWNPKPKTARGLVANPATTSASWAELASSMRLGFIAHDAREVRLTLQGHWAHDTNTAAMEADIGLNGTTGQLASRIYTQQNAVSGDYRSFNGTLSKAFAEATRHYATPIGRTSTGALAFSQTWVEATVWG